MRMNILLACGDCKRRNYATQKNKKNTTPSLN
jgi:large subunit ribosomal protein L33